MHVIETPDSRGAVEGLAELTNGRKGKGQQHQEMQRRRHRWRGKIRGETRVGGYAESQGNSGLAIPE